MAVTIPLEDNYEAILTQALAADAASLTVYVSKTPVCTIPAGKEVVITIDPGRGFLYQENCLMESYDAVNKTITLKTAGRAVARYAGDTATALPHAVGAKIIISDNYWVWENTNDYLPLAGGIMTGPIQFGDALTQIRHDAGDMKFKSDSQAEVTLSQLASGAGVNDKTKVSAADTTEGYLFSKLAFSLGLSGTILNPGANESYQIGIDTTEPTLFSQTGAANKVPVGTPSGLLDPSWIPQENPETGVSGNVITDKEILNISNSSGRMEGTDADAIATAAGFIGIANSAAGGADVSLNYTPFGPVVDIPTLAMAEYANGVLTAATPTNVVEDIDTDAPTAIAERRAQTFTTANNTWEDNIATVSLQLTKTGAPSGNSIVRLHATSGGLPISRVANESQAASDTADAVANSAHWRAQTFTPTVGGYLSDVDIYLTKVGSPGGNSTVTLTAVAAGVPTGAALATATVRANSGIATGTITFTFPTPYLLVAGTTYAIVHSPGTVSAGNTLSWDYQNSDAYAGGNSAYSTNSGGAWTASAYDRRFTVYTNGELGRATVANASIATGINLFTFATPVAVSANTVYALVYEAGGTSAGNVVAWDYKNGDVYAGGQSAKSTDSGQNWTAEAGYDRWFRMQYGAIYGLPAFVSTATGGLTLLPAATGSGDFNRRIGFMVSNNKLLLSAGIQHIYATFNFTADAPATVDTEITIGFRPMMIFASGRNGAGTTVTNGSMGHWMQGGSSMSLENKGTFISANGASQFFGYATGSLLYFDNDSNPAAANFIYVTMTVQATSANTVTIRRVVTEDTAGSMTPYIYLHIIGW